MVETIKHLLCHERLTCFQSCNGRGDGADLPLDALTLASESECVVVQCRDRILGAIKHLGGSRPIAS